MLRININFLVAEFTIDQFKMGSKKMISLRQKNLNSKSAKCKSVLALRRGDRTITRERVDKMYLNI